ncbi:MULTISPECIES: thioredoxin family protein [Bacillus]|uniref:thioredoxin family protein n=1 Tax=Bacillus TaxID=1386 RepID=UPI000CF189A2|nr:MULTISPECIES: thioredoxin family protein [Bacillus]MCM3278201.1 thioredoxin family protein [Bacillus velezensis]MCM3351321.1 thioredoxin family protein [Bacillus velezensis]MCW8785916.1 thioredoxin family protein [Bacillus velezensis]PQB11528.1 thiol reductase thioredoxin [Bacillus velezensis]QHJ03713.1 thioredoxin [Bacillus sp. AM1(2019)]
MKLIKLEQPDCNPCRMVSNYLKDMGVEYNIINVIENPEVAAEYGVMGVPVTILIDSKGGEVKRSTGFKPEELEDLISKL